jgi:hypothetical protein
MGLLGVVTVHILLSSFPLYTSDSHLRSISMCFGLDSLEVFSPNNTKRARWQKMSNKIDPLKRDEVKIILVVKWPFRIWLFWYHFVTLNFNIKTKRSSYVCLGSSCHTYDQNVNLENQCIYNINVITWDIVFKRRLGRHSHRATAEQSNPRGNWPGATQASRRNLPQRSPSHLYLMNNVIARVSRLMVTTKQVKGEHKNKYAGSKQTKVLP